MRANEIFETILDEGAEIPPTEYGYWLSPEGEFVVVGYQLHGKVMRELGVCKTSGWREAYEGGWVRIGSNVKEAPNMLFAEFSKGALTSRAMSAIRRLARSQDFTKFYMTAIAYDGRGNIEKNFDQMRPFLTAVQESGFPIPTTPLGEAAVPITAYGYWIDDLGEIHPVDNQEHLDFIKSYNDPLIDSYDEAFAEGWIRVVLTGKELQVQMKAGTYGRRQLSSLRRIISANDFEQFYLEIGTNYEYDNMERIYGRYYSESEFLGVIQNLAQPRQAVS